MAIIRIPLNLPLTIHSFTHSFILSFTPSFIQFEVWLVRIDGVSGMSPKSGHTHSDGHKIPVIPTSNDGHAARIEESHILHGVPLIFRLILMLQSISFHVFFLSPDRFNRSFSTEMSVLIPDSGKFDLHAYEQTAKKKKRTLLPHEFHWIFVSVCIFPSIWHYFFFACFVCDDPKISIDRIGSILEESVFTYNIHWMDGR